MFPGLLAVAIGRRITNPPRISRNTCIAAAASLLIAATLFHDLRYERPAQQWTRLLIPPPLPQSDNDPIIIRNRRIDTVAYLQLRTAERNGIHYRRPLTTDQCWAAPIPCAPEELAPAIHLRDPARGFRAGFVH